MPPFKPKKLSVIILNYNSGHYLLDCLQSLYQSKLPPNSWEIIVADNASTDNSFENLKSIKNKKVATHFLQNGANLGFSKGNNAALKHAKGQLILFLNPDTLVPPDTLPKILAFMEKSPQIAAATCRVVLAKTARLGALSVTLQVLIASFLPHPFSLAIFKGSSPKIKLTPLRPVSALSSC